MSSVVQRLPIEVAERIAAGEVVDRPSSIIKELLENSIDAGATEVEIEVLGGGRDLIRVSDNGSGMTLQDVELSVERHATSKLRAWEDLDSLESFGFRGEALPSVAAVSRLEILTANKEEEVGTRLRMDGPLSKRCEATSLAVGTTVCVRDLFWNTPARRKFLKSASAESVQIAELVMRFAVLNPDLGLKLIIGDKEKLFFHRLDTAATRLATLWKIAEDDLLQLAGGRDGVSVEGFIAAPVHHNRNRGPQILAVNNRLIRSQTLSQAIVEGFSPLIPKGRFPFAYVHLKIDPSQIDVNIHPTKAEVRFADNQAPFRAIYHSIADTLVKAEAETLKKSAWESVLDFRSVPGPPPITYGESKDRPAPKLPLAPLGLGAAANKNLSSPPGIDSVMELFRPAKEDLKLTKASSGYSLASYPGLTTPSSTEQLDLNTEAECLPELPRRIRYLSSLYRSYLVMEVDGELWVVDQHAAHERIQYEKLHRFQALGPQSQGLLVPLIIELSPLEQLMLASHQERFREIGFEFAYDNSPTLYLNGIPAGIAAVKCALFFKDILSQLLHDGLSEATPIDQYREKLRATVACKSSVRARESVSEVEAIHLLTALLKSERSPYCPHGRPTRIRLDQPTLERLFQRT